MSFTSQAFGLFFVLFLPVYFLTKHNRLVNNIVIVAGSCVFYGWWNWWFVPLFGLTTIVDFYAARLIAQERNEARRRAILWASIGSNLTMLGYFKYAGFITWNLGALSGNADLADVFRGVILPVGISFYTFQSMSYTIDVYREEIEPSKSLWEFLAYVSFFPHMVAGPIQKATHFLPQFRSERAFSYELASDGVRQILWGLAKKIVIADNLAPLVDQAFAAPAELSAPRVAVAAIFFSVQIYCDFSGYADIAIGLAKIMGFDLSKNFAYPYLATNIQEFWRRWHISLTNWFRKYVYYPLGGSAAGGAVWFRNIVLVFLLSGFWHGANWTFLVWGAIHAAAFVIYVVFRETRIVKGVPAFVGWIATMSICNVAWIFFRAATVDDGLTMTRTLFTFRSWLHRSNYPSDTITLVMFAAIAALLLVEWHCRHKDYPFQSNSPITATQAAFIIPASVLIGLLGASAGTAFIYFQF